MKNCGSLVAQVCLVAGTLADKLGVLLFQLPPNLKKDLALFEAFLGELPPKVCAAFEFRHQSWLDEEIFERLKTRNLALCVADSEKMSTPVRITREMKPSASRRNSAPVSEPDREKDHSRLMS